MVKLFNGFVFFLGIALGYLSFNANAKDAEALVETDVAKKVEDTKEAPAAVKRVSAAEWFPDQTQGFARIVDFPRFMERWDKTQLGKLGKHPRLNDFWQEQQKEIEGRFADAGWQLNLKVEDISSVATGQAAVGWISKPQQTQKPYSVCLVVAVAEKQDEVDRLLKKVDTELKARKATTQKIDFKGHALMK